MPREDLSELLDRLRGGDPRAVAEVVDRYGPAIRRHIAILMRQRDAPTGRLGDFDSIVESRFNDSLLHLMERLDPARKDEGHISNEEALDLLSYLKAISLNVVLDHDRSMARRRELPEDFPAESGDCDIESGDERLWLDSMMGRLPEACQEVLRLYRDGISDDRAAEILGVTPGALRARRSRCYAKLRELAAAREGRPGDEGRTPA